MSGNGGSCAYVTSLIEGVRPDEPRLAAWALLMARMRNVRPQWATDNEWVAAGEEYIAPPGINAPERLFDRLKAA